LINGYEAYYEWDKVKEFVDVKYGGERAVNGWQICPGDLNPEQDCWFGVVGADKSVVKVTIPGVSGIDLILGGHLHIVLNPSQELTDPSGRKVVLQHSGAFSKYLGRLDLVLQFPTRDDSDARRAEGAEIVS